MKFKAKEKKSNYRIEVNRFLNRLKIRNTQHNDKEFDAQNILKTARDDYNLSFWLKVFFIVLFIIIAFIFYYSLIDLNENLALYLFFEIILLDLAIFVVYFPKLSPKPVSYNKINSKIKSLEKDLLISNPLDISAVEDYLLTKKTSKEFTQIDLLKIYYKRTTEVYLNDKTIKLKHKAFTRLLYLFYAVNKTMDTRTNNEELAYLLGVILCTGSGKMSKDKLSLLKQYDKIKDPKISYDEHEKMRAELVLAKQIAKDVVSQIDNDINEIDDHFAKKSEKK